MDYINKFSDFPLCLARIFGNTLAPNLYGLVRFYQTPRGVWVEAEAHHLPPNETGFYGFHIHEYGNCELGAEGSYYKSAGGHYNPTDQPHPRHSGDLPMLLATSTGYARLFFLTDRFTVKDIIGRSVIIHIGRDDYTSQPSGNSGARIGCGIITMI